MIIHQKTRDKLVFMSSKSSNWAEFRHRPASLGGGIMMGSSPQFVCLTPRNIKSLNLWITKAEPASGEGAG